MDCVRERGQRIKSGKAITLEIGDKEVRNRRREYKDRTGGTGAKSQHKFLKNRDYFGIKATD